MPKLTIQEDGDLEGTDPAQQQLENILEERLKGPFIEITDLKAMKERVMAKALAKAHQQ